LASYGVHKHVWGKMQNKLHKSTKIKLVWPFTSNVRRGNGKKKAYKWKPMLRRPLGRPKNR
jgi:hypothetical protein